MHYFHYRKNGILYSKKLPSVIICLLIFNCFAVSKRYIYLAAFARAQESISVASNFHFKFTQRFEDFSERKTVLRLTVLLVGKPTCKSTRKFSNRTSLVFKLIRQKRQKRPNYENILYAAWKRKPIASCSTCYLLHVVDNVHLSSLYLPLAVLMPSYSFSLPLIRRHMLAIFSFQPLHRLGHERFHFCTFHPTIFTDLSTLS